MFKFCKVHRIIRLRPAGLTLLVLAVAAARSLAAQPGVVFEPLSRAIGLGDIVLTPGGQTIIDAKINFVDYAGSPVVVDLEPTVNAASGAWRARVMTGGPDPREAIIRWTRDDGSARERAIRLVPRDLRPLATPAWAMGRVWYQVFPERWRNGVEANDPAGPMVTTLDWLTPWWTVAPVEIEAALNRRLASPRWHGYRAGEATGAIGAVVFERRYGGDLQGVVEKLDHLVDLGADGLYLCPIFKSRSLHKYDAADHRHIDPAFGARLAPERVGHEPIGSPADASTWDWTEADRYFIDVLLPEAKRRGLRVMLDGVWNHVGLDHFAFEDVLERGVTSAYADWFEVEFDSAGRVAGWAAWDRTNGHLPAFRQTADGDLAPGPKAHIFAVTRRWMDPDGDGDPADGIDGWRLDVAAEIGRPFWRDWRALVKSIHPEALIIAELWEDGARYYDGTAFDGQMHYPFAFAATAWLGRDPGFTAEDFANALRDLWGERPQVDLVQLTLLASHDTERLGSMLDHPGRNYDSGGGTAAVLRGDYRRGPVSERGRALSVLGAAMQSMSPGSPMIYGGDEFGLAGPDDPHNRQPIVWPEQAAAVEPARRPSPEVLDGYRWWLGLRSHPEAGPVLRYGSWSVRAGDDPDEVVIERRLNGVSVIAALRRDGRPVPAERGSTLARTATDNIATFSTPSANLARFPGRVWIVKRR